MTDETTGGEVAFTAALTYGMSDDPTSATDTFYVLVCRPCGTGPMPFPSPRERGQWATAHTQGTGHDSWIVIDQRNTP